MNHIALSGLVAFADAARQLLCSSVLSLLCCTVALQFRVMKQAKCITKVIKIGSVCGRLILLNVPCHETGKLRHGSDENRLI